jgi:hypothetical protein
MPVIKDVALFIEPVVETTTKLVFKTVLSSTYSEKFENLVLPIVLVVTQHSVKHRLLATSRSIIRTNLRVFRTCMQYTNNNISISCFAALGSCAALLYPGFLQQNIALAACQGWILAIDEMIFGHK